MSQVPAKISTTPAQRRPPKAASVAAANVNTRPTTVTWLGVKGTRPTADIKASARRRTQASNRVVNMSLLGLLWCFLCGHSGFLVDLDHLRRDDLPRVPARLLMSVGAHPASQLGITSEDDQG